MNAEKASMKRAIIVVGMHRSGTSALTRVLNLLGVELGSRLLPAGKGNRHGHWEHHEVVTIHETLLRKLGRSWDDTSPMPAGWLQTEHAIQAREQLVEVLSREFSDVPLWAVKDPRTCRLLPLWKQVLEQLGVEACALFVVRHPAEVSGSLLARDGIHVAASRLNWFEHMAEAETATRSWARGVVLYDELLSDWRSVMDGIGARLHLDWPVRDEDASAAIDAFLDKSERHNQASITSVSHEPADVLYARLAACVDDEHAWSSVSAWVDEYERWSDTIMGGIGARLERLTRLEQESAELRDTIRDQERKLFGLLETIHGKDLHIQNRDMLIERKDALILERDEMIGRFQARIAEKEDQITALGKAQERMEQRVDHQVQELQARLELMERSRSWRLTAPLRWMNRKAGTVTRAARALIFAVLHPRRYLRLARELGPVGAMAAARRFMVRGGPQQRPNDEPAYLFDIRSSTGQPVVILTTRHCLFIARLMVHALERLGISSEIIFECPSEGFRDVPHFVICPQMFEELPGLYVAFQMEQSVSSRWFTRDYLQTLENAYAIFDYSIANVKKLTDLGLSPRQFFYLPVGPLSGYGDGCERDGDGYEYDVIFYGDINNARRKAFLDALEKVCTVKVISNLFGDALHRELRKAKLVVNIHYYEGALLETTRLWECLSLGKFVISERSSDMHEHEDLVGLVDFVDVGDIDAMVQRVRHWLEAGDELEQRMHRNEEAIRTSSNRFDYFFYRFMLYSGNMSFNEFWEHVGDKLPAPCEKLCLNLPEYVDRAEAFDQDNAYGFTRFAGLKHPHGWMGCAMSYKFMAMWARKHGMRQLTVCEDDVEFPEDFDSRWGRVSRHLDATDGSWDMFSGILADLHEDANILDSHDADGTTYVVLDRMISTVYNVYGEKALQLLAEWNDQDYDVESNTIDRYMERCTDLRVMTTLPFLVGHKEELYSTLWGMQNTQYSVLIDASQKLLEEKMKQWRSKELASK